MTDGPVVYHGVRTPGRLDVWRVHADDRRDLLSPRMDLRLCAPAGFDWGGEGGGERQLALALLADAIDDAAAVALHDIYAVEVISGLGADRWELSSVDVLAWASRTMEMQRR